MSSNNIKILDTGKNKYQLSFKVLKDGKEIANFQNTGKNIREFDYKIKSHDGRLNINIDHHGREFENDLDITGTLPDGMIDLKINDHGISRYQANYNITGTVPEGKVDLKLVNDGISQYQNNWDIEGEAPQDFLSSKTFLNVILPSLSSITFFNALPQQNEEILWTILPAMTLNFILPVLKIADNPQKCS